jgi:hypothetical protein
LEFDLLEEVLDFLGVIIIALVKDARFHGFDQFWWQLGCT